MSRQVTHRCDVCGAQQLTEAFRQPKGWSLVDVKHTDGSAWGSSSTEHATCSRACLGQLFARLAADNGAALPTAPPAPTSGQPYR